MLQNRSYRLYCAFMPESTSNMPSRLSCGLPLICPACGAPLDTTGDRKVWLCPGCGHACPVTLGIGDVRHPARLSPGGRADQVAARLVASFPLASYAELFEQYLDGMGVRSLPPNLQNCFWQYRSGQRERGSQFLAMFLGALQACAWPVQRNVALEIGCGSGAGLLSLAKQFECVVGLDPDLASLVLARKALDEHGVHNVLLLRGHAQHLPLMAGSLDLATAQNTLEHVFEIDTVVSEIHRVLVPGGAFAGDSRNRFDLFFPEPHTGLRWVGWLSRGVARAYVRWRTGTAYDHTWLLSFSMLNRAFKQSFGPGNYQILYPSLVPYGQSARADKWLQRLRRIPWLATLVLWVFPTHLVVARRR